MTHPKGHNGEMLLLGTSPKEHIGNFINILGTLNEHLGNGSLPPPPSPECQLNCLIKNDQLWVVYHFILMKFKWFNSTNWKLNFWSKFQVVAYEKNIKQSIIQKLKINFNHKNVRKKKKKKVLKIIFQIWIKRVWLGSWIRDWVMN